MKIIGIIVSILMTIFAIVALTFGLQWVGLEWKGFLGPKKANVEREIFKETKAYNEGKQQQLAKYYYEYNRSTTEKQESIAATVRHTFADYPTAQVNDLTLRNFLRSCKE